MPSSTVLIAERENVAVGYVAFQLYPAVRTALDCVFKNAASASRADVLALTKSAAQEYATHGIRVNALVPGAFRTPMLEGVMRQAAGDDDEALAQVEARYQELAPFGRIGKPQEAAAAVLWLCSDAAAYVTGHSLIVDGGATAYAR
ncbi:MAG: SDR family oxidoreductase [Chloroflexota bacterium]